MCDIKKIYEEKERVVQSINDTLAVSGAHIFALQQEMNNLNRRARENKKKLSLLL